MVALNIADSNVVADIPKIVNSHVKHLISKDMAQNTNAIYDALRQMLNGNYEKYIFNEETIDRMIGNTLSEIEMQKAMFGLNERQSVRKTNGVYYTPKDVVAFIISNCFIKAVNMHDEKIAKSGKSDFSIDQAQSLACKKNVLDPTCGSGEFLISALQEKIKIISKFKNTDDSTALEILSTIHGNDINIESIEITKVRLFFELIKHITDSNRFSEVAKIINSNMTTEDFVDVDSTKFAKYDIIIGNPPYVEDSKSISRPKIRYGNIYANVLQNSIDLLSDNGVMGFIIPISYVSTPRMGTIRKYIKDKTSKQFVLNFADRPDCLFASVHQKLSILIATKGNAPHKLFTSSYNYWYKSEREKLFDSPAIIKNPYQNELFYPKAGNKAELSIFKKVFTEESDNVIDSAISGAVDNVFLNMRACFWIKAFSFNPGSKEYKGFSFDETAKDFMLCLLNSSLFFLFWILTSDCWHITAKELKHFKVAENVDSDAFCVLAKELENELENTKKYIGSKQTDYEYKHKLCKHVIDKIDDSLAEVYSLTKTEVSYIKSFALKYRKSLGG